MSLDTQSVSPRFAREATASEQPTLFRFATAGSVDDGKSTLVGRLLHDSKAILADQLEQVARTSADRGFAHGEFDFALLTDGLRAEREQGITIDVAYRYFATGARSFILADCPGHVQYTRNMVTGATTADAVVVLVDARKGVVEQTRRHLAVVALLRVPHVILAVNKIDLTGFDADAFAAVAADARAVSAELGIEDLHVLPVSALEGDNIVDRSARTPWYDGPALLELLETLPAADEAERRLEPLRLPVQLVLRPQGGLAPDLDADTAESLRDYRAVAGRISSGVVRVGDRVEIFPSGLSTQVTGIRSAGVEVDEATAPESVSLEFADDLDVARGALVVAAGSLPEVRREFDAELFQLDARTLTPGIRVLVKHGTATVQAIVAQIESRYDLDTLTHEPARELQTNDIGRVRLRLAADLPLEPYRTSRHEGSFLVIHPSDGATLAAGIVRG
ncbi:MAG: sulfate adenylyltransferase [Microbacterium sp. SCN 70-200]|uniref:sulfate adenylyltransferase subunit 1 n=1 Tax=unclassified Microbacterium TaxID=2609290 RepID=UPI00086DAD0B|nr:MULTISPECIES: GTP-binding protein [unclassified Microbacterium]MBN9214900.1 50S ribosome-binding GTPase [Microbacterium sp.]ODT42999.1 MAG: sulfate adenylyltransferase [Microbacterium sp. SCN 70-200]OJV84696.1 MAG: sulfate adenylyltransferase [Microbacterium sp. 70-16]